MSDVPERAQSSRRIGFLAVSAAGAVACFCLAFAARTAWLASLRPAVVAAGTGTSAAAVLLLLWRRLAVRPAGAGRRRSLEGSLLLALWLAALAAFVGIELRFRGQRAALLALEQPGLARLGRHVMVGYRDTGELRQLVARGAVGGIFVTARNAAAKSVAGLAAEIAGLQALARANGHGPLIVATDQEGGMVSRLSPPLPRPVPLADLARAHADAGALDRAVREHAFDVGRHLASVGVTLNFAPVADLDFGIRDPADRLSRVGERAIGSDPALVGRVAQSYCRGLLEAGVLCTLKHFPGLGRVRGDTHIATAELTAPQGELEAMDWRPFRAVLEQREAAVMMAHVVYPPLDPARPASASAAMIGGVLRGQWRFDGLVVTDDLTMLAASGGPGGIGAAGVGAFAAGADLLLVAYDTDQVYALLAALLTAAEAGEIPAARLEASARRLARLARLAMPAMPAGSAAH